MKFTISWLNEYVQVKDLNPALLADKLTMLGLEVETVQELYRGVADIVTARVRQVRKHPNADRLTLCDVEVGDETIQVVCGAPNVREGLVTALARPGTVVGSMKIKKAKVRGEVSMGMLCSEKELGLSEDHSGIMELDDSIASGLPLAEVLELDDTMIEIDLTPNRPDCASVIGIAREVAGVTRRELTIPVTDRDVPAPDNDGPEFSVRIDEPELCPRYAATKLVGVTIKPSPWWLQKRLMAVGMRPINNIVDITNYVMLEYGQPLHAFDFQKLAGGAIVVRRPSADEMTFTTLDGVERTLSPDTLMICDRDKPVAVAGVMGGLDSEVTDVTTEVLLESACFDPVSIRRTARKLNLPSEASYRFERGVDPNGCARAMERAVRLMVELAGATVKGAPKDLYPGKKEPLILKLRVQRVCQLLGIELGDTEIADYLRGIGFEVEGSGEVLQVRVPSFRIDIEREVDLVEEIARLVGYNDIPTTLPKITMDYPERDPLRTLRQDIAELLRANGFCEAINYSFVSEKHWDMMGLGENDPRRQATRLLNPLSEDQAVMRTMLLPGLLENIRRNINYQQTDIRLFETGKTFIQREQGSQPEERFQLCVVMSGNRYPGARPLYFSGLQADFFDVKGVAESLLRELRIAGSSQAIEFREPESGAVQPYGDPAGFLTIMDGNTEIGRLGRLHPATAKQFSIKQEVYFLEMDVETLCGLPRAEKSFKPLPKFPAVKRDIALVVPEEVEAGKLLEEIHAHKAELVEHADIFDVYRGKPIEPGMKSVALTVTYRSAEKTLDDETVDRFHDKIVSSLMSRFGGRYREGQ
ncbi:phenylalanine--tRNA ligase beta subunit [Desulfolithobacter dissulfuricans]|uniref:Phenylalanine--tRNA ligase beta subunit n=1 Tax=Desulfolithobacter dissulfuricans TaxID=2795293 RepID=A0A915XKP8_9BACT|nr:phenylalanine--tRNA ligase subunit beta [Desulfolithobacter dissulfuricans]BCO09538.1 phenylalanine--tRNA ligase beta subunit [Desulfolithobacter dissulfuricans]